jgi:MFS family permease
MATELADPEASTPSEQLSEQRSEQPWPDERTAWYAVTIMGFCTLFAIMDQNIVSLLAQSIKDDLGISDTKLSLLLGLSFALFYTFVGLPMARFVDRNSRKTILGLGVAVWSAATAFCGIAQNFWQLFAARVFVGAGEAVNGPAVYSMISDYFPKEKLPRAIAVMQIGSLAGGGFSLLFGAVLIYFVSDIPDIHVPLIGVIRWWQLVFIAIGLPGLVVAALVSTVPEPARRQLPGQATQANVKLRTVFRYLFTEWRIYGPMFGGLAVGALGSGAQAWMIVFYFRTYGWGPAKAAAITGPIQMAAMLFGLFVGVWLSERYFKAKRDDSPYRVLIIARAIGLPAALLLPLMPSPWLAVAMGAVSSMTIAMGGMSQNAALQIITPNQMRGQVTALYLFLFSVVGSGLSPTVLALFTDYVFQAEDQIRYAILMSAAIFSPLALFIMWLGLKPYAREVARLKGQNG